MNIAVIDCYDSFTFNLVHYLEQLVSRVNVFRNDKVEVNQLARFDAIVLSPGPGLPGETENLSGILRAYSQVKPILGICLGHQAIGEFFGMKLINLPRPLHGVALPITVVDCDEPLFKGLPQKMDAGRYHSWAIERTESNQWLKVTAVDGMGLAMAFSHRQFPLKSVQFHPESVLTPMGFLMLSNWVKFAERSSL